MFKKEENRASMQIVNLGVPCNTPSNMEFKKNMNMYITQLQRQDSNKEGIQITVEFAMGFV